MKKNKQPTTFRPTRTVKQGSRYHYNHNKQVAVDLEQKEDRPARHALPFLAVWLPVTLLVACGFFLSRPAQSEIDNSTLAQTQAATFSGAATFTVLPPAVAKAPLTIPAFPTPTVIPAPQVTPSPTPRQSLPEVINNIIKKYKDGLGKQAEFGIFIQNIDTGENFEVNSQKLFETGSVYKIFVMLTVLSDISQNKFNLDTQITLTADIPQYTLEEDGGVLIVPVGGSKSVRDLLFAMINHSNNTAALMLLGKVRTAHMSDLVNSLGMTGSNLTDSFNFRTTAADLNIYFSKLANNKLLGSPYDEQMIELLSKQQFRTKIPGLLPPGTKVANKVGDFPGVSNDTGIIFLPNGERVSISVLIHDTNVEGAEDFISQISLATYNYFNQKS